MMMEEENQNPHSFETLANIYIKVSLFSEKYDANPLNTSVHEYSYHLVAENIIKTNYFRLIITLWTASVARCLLIISNRLGIHL